MPNIYVTKAGSTISVQNERIHVDLQGERLLDVALRRINTIVCIGRVHLTTHAIHSCLDSGIDLSFVTRSGRFKGRLAAPISKNIYLRLAQYENCQNDQACLTLTRQIVKAKLANTRNVLRKFSYNHPSEKMNDVIRKLEKINQVIDTAKDAMRIRGLEGIAARLYFGLFDEMLRCDMKFERRSTQPPLNEVNALLSLTYVLVMNEIYAFLEGMGFDPHVGFFHTPGYGKPSLALDLLEPFRSCLCDVSVIRLCNLRIVEKKAFTTYNDRPGFRLTDQGLKEYLENYEQRMTREFLHPNTGKRVTWRDCLRLEAEAMRDALVRGKEYKPFISRV